MSGSVAPPITLELTVVPTRPVNAVPGQGVRLKVLARNATTKALIAVTGLVVIVRPPRSDVPISYSQAQLTAVRTGEWALDLVLDRSARWRFRAECTAPRPAAIETPFEVSASSVVQPEPPDALLVTPEGEVIVTPDGGALTARRVDRLSAAGTIVGTEKLVVIQGDEPRTTTMDGLLAEAVTRGGAAGATAAAAIGGAAGAASGATAGAAAAQPAKLAAEAARTGAEGARDAASASATSSAGSATAASLSAASAGLSASVAIAAQPIYVDTAAGLAATAEGGYFSVAGSGNDFAILYREVGGAAVEQGRFPSRAALDAALATVAAVPARKSTATTTMARFVDRLGRAYAAIDDAGRRFYFAGMQFTRQSDGTPRWQRFGAAGPYVDLRADGIETDGARVGFAGKGLRSVAQVTAGGLVDWFRIVDRASRGVIRMGLGHIIAGTIRIRDQASGAIDIAGRAGTLIERGASTRTTLPGRLTDQVYSGAHLILSWANGRRSAFRIDPVDGALRLIGFKVASAAPDFTATELAALDTEAAAYSDSLTRQSLNLQPPSAGLNLFLATGQSNQVGQQSVPPLSTTPPPDCFMFGNGVHPAVLNNTSVWSPMGGNPALQPLRAIARENNNDRVLTQAEIDALDAGAGNHGETALEAFAAQFRRDWLRAQGKPNGDPANRWVFASCGQGGRTVAQLSPGASPEIYNKVRDVIAVGQTQAAALGVSFVVAAAYINQGESDYSIDTPYADYVTGKSALIAALRSTVATATGQTALLPVYLQQTNGSSAHDSFQSAVARAQLEVARTVPGVFLVSNNQVYPDRGLHMGPHCHRWIGCQMGKFAKRAVIDGQNPQCTHLIRAGYRKRTVVLLFHAPAPPLRFLTPYMETAPAASAAAVDRGLYIEDDGGSVTIVDARCQGQLVIATIGRDILGTATVWLGRKARDNGAICIADSDQYPLVYSYVPITQSQWAAENIAELTGRQYGAANFALADVQTIQSI